MVLPTKRIATAALEESWLQVRSKAAILSAPERAEYLPIHAALVVQQHVDELLQENPAMPNSVANRMILRATVRVVAQLSLRLERPVPSGLVHAN
jgi:hypothetical protein